MNLNKRPTVGIAVVLCASLMAGLQLARLNLYLLRITTASNVADAVDEEASSSIKTTNTSSRHQQIIGTNSTQQVFHDINRNKLHAESPQQMNGTNRTQGVLREVNSTKTQLVLPNVLLIGAQKAGTTALAQWMYSNGICHGLQQPGEPEYFTKEIHFFDHPERLNQGIEFYSQRFEHCARQHKDFILDATPNYLDIPEKVYETYTDEKAGDALSKLKLIAILREPISRELSWYNHKVQLYSMGERDDWVLDIAYKNRTIKSFDAYSDWLLAELNRTGTTPYGCYVDHLKRWVELFDRQQLLILSYHELLQEPSSTQSRIQHFLTGDNKLTGNFQRENTQQSSQKVKEIPVHAKEAWGELFREKNEELYRFLERNPGPLWEQRPFPHFELD